MKNIQKKKKKNFIQLNFYFLAACAYNSAVIALL